MKNWRTLLACLLLVSALYSCKHDPYLATIGTGGVGDTTTVGSGANGAVCFETDILPLLSSGCARSGCHDAATHEEGYILDSYNNIMKKGVKAGNASGSKIFEVLLKSGSDRMPPPPNAGFTTAQISLVAKWINEGAKNTTGCNTTKCDTATVTYSKSVAPIINTACLGCHSNALASGGYNFSTHAGVKAAVTNGRLMGSINYLTGFSGMPQGYKLNSCQLATIKKWVDAGALNN